MAHKKIWVILSIALVVILAVTACSPAATPTAVVMTVEVPGENKTEVVVATPLPTEAPPAPTYKLLRIAGSEGDIPTLDTALAVDSPSIQFIESTSIGLVRQNEETALVEPGMAESWEISDDGLVYTFHLRSGVPWVRHNGVEVEKVLDCDGNERMVTAEDFRYGILRTLDPATASDYAYVLNPVIVGAAAFNDGSVTDPETVAVKALDPQTLEVTVTSPAVYNLNILGLWVAHAMPRWIIDGDDCTEARGLRWTETGFFQGYGPFTLKEWVHDTEYSIVKNPFWPGTPEIPVAKIDEIVDRFLAISQGLAEFEAGNMEIASVPTADFDRIMGDPELSAQVAYTQTIGTEFYAFSTQQPPTDDARVRLALSLAIDREAIVNNVNKSGNVATWFTHPGAAGAPRPGEHPDLEVNYDPDRAKALLDEYLAETGQTADQLTLTLLFNTSEAHKARAEAIQQMWMSVLGVNVQLFNQERAVFFTMREEGKENIYRGSWVQDYPDANNFLFDVFGPGGGYADVVDWTSGEAYETYLDLLAQAAAETDDAAREDLYSQAEKILVQDEAVIAPIYWYNTPILVASYVQDIDSVTGYDHYEKWDMTPQ